MSARLRSARPDDAGVLGEILWRFQHHHDWMPEIYSLMDCIASCATMIENGWVTVAQAADGVRGFLARDGEEICALYLAPPARRQGVGRLLLDDAKAASARLELRCVEANTAARRFYRRQGFVENARSDGSREEDMLPDITFVWPATGGRT